MPLPASPAAPVVRRGVGREMPTARWRTRGSRGRSAEGPVSLFDNGPRRSVAEGDDLYLRPARASHGKGERTVGAPAGDTSYPTSDPVQRPAHVGHNLGTKLRSTDDYGRVLDGKRRSWQIEPTHANWQVRSEKPLVRGPGAWSGRRDSNPRPSPWQGDALPTEPRPRGSKTLAAGPRGQTDRPLGSAAQAGSQAGDQLVGRLLVGDGVHGHRATGGGQHDGGSGLVLPGLHVELRIEVEPGDEGRPVAAG